MLENLEFQAKAGRALQTLARVVREVTYAEEIKSKPAFLEEGDYEGAVQGISVLGELLFLRSLQTGRQLDLGDVEQHIY